MATQLEFRVSDEAPLGLFLRSEPVVKPSTKIALLPLGHLVTKKAESTVAGWWKVSTTLQGASASGFVSSKYLTPSANFSGPPAHQSISPVHLRNDNLQVTRSGGSRAYPLNETPQPTRHSSNPAATKAAELTAIIKWLRVEQSARYLPHGGTTYCNIYAYDYCYLAGVYLPRVWWTPDAIDKLKAGQPVAPRYAVTVNEVNANSLFNWLKAFGPDFGWSRTFDLTELQNAANDGQVGIICAQRVDLNRSGHICPVVPETASQKAARSGSTVIKPLQSQAGGTNFSYKALVWWTNPKFREFGFWIHA